MRSSIHTLDAVAATLEHDLSEPLDEHKTDIDNIPEGDQPTYCLRAAGVLRYNRESNNHRINLTTIIQASQPLTEHTATCEYCGKEVKPSLDLTWVHRPEVRKKTVFCCPWWQQLCEVLVKQTWLAGRRCDLLRTPTPQGDNRPAAEMEELHVQGREMEDCNKFVMDLPHGFGEQLEQVVSEDFSIQIPVAETFAGPTSKVLSFRLSRAPGTGCCTVFPVTPAEKHLEIKEDETCEEVLLPFCDHKPLQFGLCHHQDGAEFLQKNYSNGTRFLTAFPDGSAQVFYPSGLLALVVVVTEENGRVCIVYDDSDTPHQPVRAVFQSDGRATCYHSNGNIWLALNGSGGQCLDEEGARVCRWSWSSLAPTPLHPVFLSLNSSVGVRVLGRERVFVSFLANGQQAKFSLGTGCTQGECKPDGTSSGPSISKEEVFVSAARIRIHLAFQYLHQYLMTPSHPRLLKTTQAPHLHAVAQRLLSLSAEVMMSKSDRAFIQRCLRDCL